MGGIAFFAVAAALSAPALPTSRVELSAAGGVSKAEPVGSISGNPTSHWGGGQLTLTIYAQRPLVDDDAPYPLQPFLQRAGRVWMFAGGGGQQWDNDVEGTVQSARWGGGAAGFDLYANRWLALTAAFVFRDTKWSELPGDLQHLGGRFGVGVRFGDVRLDLGYALDGYHGADHWWAGYYGNVRLGAQAVVARQLAVSGNIEVIEGGANATLAFLGFVTRKLGLSFGLSGGKGDHQALTIGGSIGVNGWVSRYLGLAVTYSPAWSAGGVDGSMTHTFNFEVTSRVR